MQLFLAAAIVRRGTFGCPIGHLQRWQDHQPSMLLDGKLQPKTGVPPVAAVREWPLSTDVEKVTDEYPLADATPLSFC
jgi:hypothetical protein